MRGAQEDNIFRVFGGDRIKGMMGAFGIDDVPLESNMLSKSLNEAQKKVELPFLSDYYCVCEPQLKGEP